MFIDQDNMVFSQLGQTWYGPLSGSAKRQHVTTTGRLLGRLTNHLCSGSVSDVIIMVHRFNTGPCRWFTISVHSGLRILFLAHRLMGHRNTCWKLLNLNLVESERLTIWWYKQIWAWLFTCGVDLARLPTMVVGVLNANSLSRIEAWHFVCPSMMIVVEFLWVATPLQLLVYEIVIIMCVGDFGWK